MTSHYCSGPPAPLPLPVHAAVEMAYDDGYDQGYKEGYENATRELHDTVALRAYEDGVFWGRATCDSSLELERCRLLEALNAAKQEIKSLRSTHDEQLNAANQEIESLRSTHDAANQELESLRSNISNAYNALAQMDGSMPMVSPISSAVSILAQMDDSLPAGQQPQPLTGTKSPSDNSWASNPEGDDWRSLYPTNPHPQDISDVEWDKWSTFRGWDTTDDELIAAAWCSAGVGAAADVNSKI